MAKNNNEKSDDSKDSYYDSIANGYNELHSEEQLKKLEIIGKEIKNSKNNSELKDFIKPSDSLLDVGCGTGISTGFFNAKKRIGIDPSRKLVDIARVHYPTIEFKVAPAETIPFKDKFFNIIISLTAIQNFNDIELGLKEIKRVGKGKYILTFLKKSSKHKLIDSLITNNFDIIKKIEEDKDIIYFCK